MSEEVKLFRTWSSPFALRIVWALKLKGVEYETIYEDLASKSPCLLKYNPVHKKVPVLLHNGNPICESLVILEYIDETWKEETPFLPQDPYQKASARFWAHFNDEKVFPSMWRFFINQGTEQEECKGPALENLTIIEELLEGKKFFNGETIGFLDLAFGWIANYLSVLEEASGQKLFDEEKFPLISAWKKSFAEVPVIKENWPDRGKLIAKYKDLHEAHLAARGAK